MYCPKCKTEIFGGSVCHLCGGLLAVSEEMHETTPAKGGVKIITRKKFRVSKEFGQTLFGRILRLMVEICIFCAGFLILSYAVFGVANWLSKEMALDQERVKLIEMNKPWVRYFWYIGCGVIVILTVRFRFKPGK